MTDHGENSRKNDGACVQLRTQSDVSSNETSLRSDASICSSLTNLEKCIEVDTKTYAPPTLREKEEEEREARRRARRDDSVDESNEEFLPTIFEDVDATLKPIAEFERILYLSIAEKKIVEKTAIPSTAPLTTTQSNANVSSPVKKANRKKSPPALSVYIMNLTPMIPLDGEVSVDPEADYFATSSSPVASSSRSSTDDDVTQSTRSVKEPETESSSRGANIFERSSYTVINASKTAAKVTGKILCKTIASPVKMVMNVKSKCDEYRSDRDRKRMTSTHNKEQNQRKMHIPLFKSHHHVSDTSRGKQAATDSCSAKNIRQRNMERSSSSSSDRSLGQDASSSSRCAYLKRIHVDRYGRKIPQYYPQMKK